MRVSSAEELIEILQAESCKRERRVRVTRALIITMVGVYFLGGLVLWLKIGHFPSDFFNTSSCFAGLGGVGLGVSSTHRKALELASESEDPGVTNYLLEAASFPVSGVASMAQQALVPRFEALVLRDKFDPETLQRLDLSLLSALSSKYANGVLEVIRRVGGRESIPMLEKFIGEPILKSKRSWKANSNTLARTVLADVRIRVAKGIIEEREQLNAAETALMIASLPTNRESSNHVIG